MTIRVGRAKIDSSLALLYGSPTLADFVVDPSADRGIG
jgi:hypothetical protein